MRRDRCGSEKCRGQSRSGAYGVTAQRSNHGKRGLYKVSQRLLEVLKSRLYTAWRICIHLIRMATTEA
jgi:hypothetical protein